MKIITWNIAQRHEAWRRLLETDADIALLQEACEPLATLPDASGSIPPPGEPPAWEDDIGGPRS